MLNSVDDYAHLTMGKWTMDDKANKLVSRTYT